VLVRLVVVVLQPLAVHKQVRQLLVLLAALV
jgi:hypothetical protein